MIHALGMQDGVLIAWRGPGQPEMVAAVARALDEIRREMALPAEALMFSPLGRSPWKTRPSLVLWFASDQRIGAEDSALAGQLADAGIPILPLADRDEALGERLPAPVLRYNVLFTAQQGEQWPEVAADEAIALIWQKRTVRRVFISYLRAEGEGVARQLWADLTRRGYEVFLDDVSIHRGVDFQQALRAWLVDADMVLMLFSPDFHTSRWAMEEVDLAQQSRTEVLALQWPTAGQPPPEWKALRDRYYADQRLELSPNDLVAEAGKLPRQQTLCARRLDEVHSLLRRRRAAFIRATMMGIIADAADRLRAHDPRILSVSGDLLTESVLIRALPFRPTLTALHALHRTAEQAGVQAATAIYHEHEPGAEAVQMFAWFSAARRETPPTTLRVVAYTGEPIDFGLLT